MKSRKILSILIALAMLLSAAATAEDGNVADDGSATAPAAAPAAAPAETAGSIAGAWTIENLTYEAKALAGGFSIKGEFQGTYELTLNPDGSMSSNLAMDTMHEQGIIPFAFPEFELKKFTGYSWENGTLRFLPDGPALQCEYNEAAGTYSVSYASTVMVEERKGTLPGQATMPGGECSLTVSLTLTGGESAGEQAPAGSGIPAGIAGKWSGIGKPKNGGPSIKLTAVIREDGSGEYTFEQNGYTESNPITLSAKDNTFEVQLSDHSALGKAEGTWALEDGVLKLDITSTLPSGRTYSYTAECTREE